LLYSLLDILGSAHFSLHGHGLDAEILQLLERRVRLGLGLGRVVVDRDVAALLREGFGDERAKVLQSA